MAMRVQRTRSQFPYFLHVISSFHGQTDTQLHELPFRQSTLQIGRTRRQKNVLTNTILLLFTEH